MSSGLSGIGSSATRRSDAGQSTIESASSAAARSASPRRMPGGTRNVRVTTSAAGAASTQRRSGVPNPVTMERIVSAILRSSNDASAAGTSSVRVSRTVNPSPDASEATIETNSAPMSRPRGSVVLRVKNGILEPHQSVHDRIARDEREEAACGDVRPEVQARAATHAAGQ